MGVLPMAEVNMIILARALNVEITCPTHRMVRTVKQMAPVLASSCTLIHQNKTIETNEIQFHMFIGSHVHVHIFIWKGH